MNLVQFKLANLQPRVGMVQNPQEVAVLHTVSTMHELAQRAITAATSLEVQAQQLASGELQDYQQLIDEKRLLPPLLHPDPAHTLISGTGLTHLGSAETRAAMHSKLQGAANTLTDSMRMFQMGLAGGKPAAGSVGVQPEWFYKGDGSNVVAPEQPVMAPDFSLDLGDEAEIAGVYIIGYDSKPYRLGFVMGNEFSDHLTERTNYLYLAHSKLRACAFGPELYVGQLPAHVQGVSRIRREGKLLWEKEFLSGENNMSHSIANLEYHHFKYKQFLRPGTVHIHFFGTGTLSFADRINTQPGDVFELESALFGRPLRNEYRVEKSVTNPDRPVQAL